MRTPYCLLSIIAFILFLFPAKSQTWQPLGPNEINEASLWGCQNPDLAVYGSTPYIVYRNSLDGKVSVRKFNGNAWEFVGPEGITLFPNSNTASITTDATGVPYIAYGDPSNNNKVTVKKYDGSNWVDVGTPAALTGTTSSNCALAITSDGTIYAAFPDLTNGNRLGVRVKYAGNDWSDITPGGVSVASVFAVSMDLDGNGNPYFAFTDNSVSGAVTVMKYTGSSFEVVGTQGISNGASNYTSIAVDAAGIPYAVFAESRNGNKMAVKKYDGSNWVYAGAPGISAAAVRFVEITIDASGYKYVVYNDLNKTVVKTFDATTSTWINTGDVSVTGGNTYTGIALDAAGIPFVVYTQDSYNNRAIVKKLTGNTWTSMGAMGISNGGAGLSWMTTNSLGVPYIMYYDLYNSQNMVIKKYDGNNWVNVGPGLSADYNSYPFITMDANDVPYVYYVDENMESVVRKFDGSNWVAVATPNRLTINSGSSCSFVISSNGTPYMAYMDLFSGMINVKKIDGGSWVSVGAADFSIDQVGYVSMTLDASGTPYVIYSDGGLSNKATVKKFDGSNWVDVGIAGISAAAAHDCYIAMDGNGTLYAGYNDNGAVVKKFDGANWVDVGMLGPGMDLLQLAVNARNVPYVVYRAGGAIGVKKFDGSTWIAVGTPDVTTDFGILTKFDFGGNGMPVLLYRNGGLYVKSFGPLTSLPLRLTAFNGHIEGGNGLLHWQTDNEINTQTFIVERSTDGRNYVTAGTVRAANESGVHQYAFTDKNVNQLTASIIYYRLKQVDIDGRFTYSRVLMLPVDKSVNRIVCYPNPVTSDTNLSITLDKAEPVQARIIDNVGNVVRVQQWNLGVGTNSITVDMNQLVKGMYYLEISSQSIKKQIPLIKL